MAWEIQNTLFYFAINPLILSKQRRIESKSLFIRVFSRPFAGKFFLFFCRFRQRIFLFQNIVLRHNYRIRIQTYRINPFFRQKLREFGIIRRCLPIDADFLPLRSTLITFRSINCKTKDTKIGVQDLKSKVLIIFSTFWGAILCAYY